MFVKLLKANGDMRHNPCLLIESYGDKSPSPSKNFKSQPSTSPTSSSTSASTGEPKAGSEHLNREVRKANWNWIILEYRFNGKQIVMKTNSTFKHIFWSVYFIRAS